MYNNLPNTLFIGSKIICLPTCHSTNDTAVQLLKENPPQGTVIITNNQTAGVGQKGNSWESAPDENLTFSVILHPSFIPIADQFWLNILLSLAIRNTVTEITREKVHIKWPNDVYIRNKKICGILIKNFIRGESIEKSVAGVGLNVNQTDFKTATAISLKQITGRIFDKEVVLHSFLKNLEKVYFFSAEGNLKELYDSYIDSMMWKGEEHTFYGDHYFRGTITGLDRNGRLKILTSEGEKTFDIKEVQYIS